MLNSCAQSTQKQADIDRKYLKQHLPDIVYINNILKSAGINPGILGNTLMKGNYNQNY